MTDIFSTWLNSPECFNDLLPCARLVIRRAEQLGITLDDSYMDSGSNREYQNAVASNLWQFLREEAESLAVKASRLLAGRDSKGLASFISKEFIDTCIDQRRTDSPFHAYYRHMRTVLSDTQGIFYKSIPRKCSYYSWSDRTDLGYLPDDHDFCTRYLNYDDWSSSDTPFSKIQEKSEMIRLSRHYWDESLRIILEEYLLSIRGLVTFVSIKYPLIPKVEYASDMDSDDADGLPSTLGESLISPDASTDDASWIRQRPLLAQSIVEVDLEKIARDCVAGLNETEKTVICGLDSRMTLAEIAARLGMKGPSNVSYHQKAAFDKLRTAWSLWGQPDSEHYAVAEEEQQIFFKKVVEICKETNGCRDSNREGES